MKNKMLDVLLVDESSFIVYQVKHALASKGIKAHIDTVETGAEPLIILEINIQIW